MSDESAQATLVMAEKYVRVLQKNIDRMRLLYEYHPQSFIQDVTNEMTSFINSCNSARGEIKFLFDMLQSE